MYIILGENIYIYKLHTHAHTFAVSEKTRDTSTALVASFSWVQIRKSTQRGNERVQGPISGFSANPRRALSKKAHRIFQNQKAKASVRGMIEVMSIWNEI